METGGRHSFTKDEIHPRTSKTPIQNKSHTILPGTPSSPSIYYLHHGETAFPPSYTFHPSRWLADPVTVVHLLDQRRETADEVSKSGLPRHKTVLWNACGVVGDVYLFSEPVQEV
jgi:hypothetical protein